MAQATKTITFIASEELAQKIAIAADERGQTPSEYIERTIELHFARLALDKVRKNLGKRAKELEIGPEEVMTYIREMRDEYSSNPSFREEFDREVAMNKERYRNRS